MDPSKIVKMRTKKEFINGLKKLCVFLKNNNVSEIVEIGSFTGESAIIFSSYFQKVTCIDAWTANYNAYEKVAKLDFTIIEEEFDKNIKNIPNIIKIKSTSLDALSLFPDNSLQFVYIDGSHYYDDVINDIDGWKKKIIPNMYLGGHDYDNVKQGHLDVKRAVLNFFDEVDLVLFEDTSWAVKMDGKYLKKEYAKGPMVVDCEYKGNTA